MRNFSFINIAFVILFSSVSVFAQDVLVEELTTDDPIAVQAVAKPKEQIGMYLFWFTQANPLKLLDDPNSTVSAMDRINPCYEIEWGYGTPWFFNGMLRFSFKFWAYGSYNWSQHANGLAGDSVNLNYMLFLHAYITPYLALEFDTRGRLQVFASYTHRPNPTTSVKYELSTRFWLNGTGYKDVTVDGVKGTEFRRSMWEYTTFDIHHNWSPRVSSKINRFTFYTRYRFRFLGYIYNPGKNPDTGEEYGEFNPNTANVFYFSTRFRMETWLSSYFAIMPLVEFVVNGTQTTTKRQPFGLNIGVLTRFQF